MSIRIEVGEDDIYNLELTLAHQINLTRCSTKVYGTKVLYDQIESVSSLQK